jgi:Carbohydrate binding domain
MAATGFEQLVTTIWGIGRRRVGLVLLSAVGLLLASEGQTFATLPDTSDPSLSFDRTIQTTPFVGTSVSMKDHEGSAFVPSDNSLWLADDNGKAVHEVDPGTGTLKRSIGRSIFNAAPLLSGGPIAGMERTNDFESIAYDASIDVLYVFSGPCCNTSILPTAFRLTRDGTGTFQVESYQPLASTADFTGAAWNPSDATLYVGKGADVSSYDYGSNIQGVPFNVPGLAGISGMVFTATDLFVTTNGEKLRRIDWATKTLVGAWTFDLTPFGVLDSRAVELIGDQFFVSDGAETRPVGDPLRMAVFVFDVTGPPLPPPAVNLVANPGFEVDTSGWSSAGSGNGVSLSRASPGREASSGAALLTNGSSGNRKCLLNDDPDSVTSMMAGVYTANIWVRGEVAGALIKIQLREMNGTNIVKSRGRTTTLTTSWQQITVTLTPLSPGGSLDLRVFLPRAQAPPGICFYADDASLTRS